MKIKLYIFSTLLLIPLLATAERSSLTNVEVINVGGNGLHGTFIGLVGYTFPSCQSTYAFIDANSNMNYDQILSVLLAAQMGNRKVSVATSGCGGNGNNYALVQEVNIY